MATRDGLAQIWYADANGVITGYTPTADNVASAIIDAYNEHYGTEINIWTPETKTLQVGDTVPNWNAYEKIVLTSQKIAAKMGSDQQNAIFILGTLTNKNFELVTSGEKSYVVDSSGIVLPIAGPPADSTGEIIGILQGVGITATSISEEIVSWDVGSVVPNWNEYTQYT